MENFEIVYLSSLLNEKAGDFIQDELKKYGYPELKMAHGDIFHVLFEAGELSAKEIAGRTRRSKSTVSELVDRLVKFGYVCKKPDPADARGVKVSLTEKGVAFEAPPPGFRPKAPPHRGHAARVRGRAGCTRRR